MKMTRCCVPNCSENATHQFPKDNKIKKLWLKAIRRINFTPSASSRLCRNHFKESDYELISKYTGIEHQHKFLKKSAVPSVFPWNVKPILLPTAREERTRFRNFRKSLFQDLPSTSYIHQDDLNLHDCGTVQAVTAISRSEPVCQSLLEPVVSVSAHEEANSDDSVVDANEEDTALCAFSWEKSHDAIPCTDEPKRNTLWSAERSGDEFKTESHDDTLHLDFKCNECGGEIVGYRYTCVQCCDFDLCGACEASGAHPEHYVLRLPRPEPAVIARRAGRGGAHPEHYVLRLPRPEPAGAVKGVLETLRGLLKQEPLFHFPPDRIKMEIDDDPLHEPIYDEPDGLEVVEEKLDVQTLWTDSRETQYTDTTIGNTSRVPHQTHVKTEAAPVVQGSTPAKRFLVSCVRAKKPKHVKPLLVDSVGPEDSGVTRAGIRTVPGTGVRESKADVGPSRDDVRPSGAGVRVVGPGVTVPGVRVAEADVGPPGGEPRASRGHVRVSGAGIKVSGAGITVSTAGVGESGPAPKRTAVVKLTEVGAIELGETKISLKPRNRQVIIGLSS